MPAVADDFADVLAALETAWSDLDAPAAAATFSADAVYVTFAGVAWQGRPTIESGLAKTFEGPLGDLRLAIKPLAVRILSPTVRLVLADVALSNDTTRIRATTTFVLVVDDHGWLIAAAHTSETPSIH